MVAEKVFRGRIPQYFLLVNITGDHSKYNLRCTQKPSHFPIFTNTLWSYLLWSSQIVEQHVLLLFVFTGTFLFPVSHACRRRYLSCRVHRKIPGTCREPERGGHPAGRSVGQPESSVRPQRLRGQLTVQARCSTCPIAQPVFLVQHIHALFAWYDYVRMESALYRLLGDIFNFASTFYLFLHHRVHQSPSLSSLPS